MVKPKTNVVICGIGNFGYAVLKHLDSKNLANVLITAYDYDKKIGHSLAETRHHPYLHKSTAVSNKPQFITSPAKLSIAPDILILSVPSHALKSALVAIKPVLTKPLIIVNTAKALDSQTGKRLSEIVRDELGGVEFKYALLAGGTIANDLYKHQPLGIDIACEDSAALKELVTLFASKNLYVNGTKDLIGVEYAAAFKNVISMLAGIVHGLGFSYGAETYIISRTAGMIEKVAVSQLGASPQTYSASSQCWGNDLWMSATGKTRNREFGVLLGKGLSPDQAIAKMKAAGKTVEGVNTIKVVSNLDGFKTIKPIELLYEFIINKSVDVSALKNYLLETHDV